METPHSFTPWLIEPAPVADWAEVFALALRNVPEAERAVRVLNALTLAALGEVPAEGILAARAAGQLAGAQIYVPLAGASGLFWPPQASAGFENQGVEDRLVQAALVRLRQRGAKLASAMLPAAEALQAAPLLRNGFRHVTELLYLRHDLTELADDGQAVPFRIETFSQHNEAVFRDTLVRTYEGTHDCPELNGVRTGAEILEGHRAQGIFRPEYWWLIRQDDEPAGVVVINEIPGWQGWDLSYLGVMPQRRRCGLGRALTRAVLRAAGRAGAAHVLLAVDGRNLPARALYHGLGFVFVEGREVYLCLF